MPAREPMQGIELIKNLAELDRKLAEKVEETRQLVDQKSRAPKQRASAFWLRPKLRSARWKKRPRPE